MREARSEVRARQFDAALAIFQRLAQQDPRDYEARNWVARLESWKRNYPKAEDHYRSVLADAPSNLEAELGLADVLAWQGKYAEAMMRLHTLRNQHPSDLDVLLRLGRFAMWQHDRSEALWHYREALAVDPNNAEARRAVQALNEEKPFRVEAGYLLENYDFFSNTNGQFVELDYQNYNRVTLLGRFQYQNKFGQNDTIFTVGSTYRFGKKTWVRGEVSLAPHSNTVVPDEDFTIELTQGISRGLAAGGSYRQLNFQGARVQVPGALVNWDLISNLHFYLRYTPSRTRFQTVPQRVWNHGGWSRLDWDANRRFSPYALFAIGAEDFAAISSDQLGRFSAHTYGLGTKINLTPTQAIRVGYFYQSRTLSHREHFFGASYIFRF